MNYKILFRHETLLFVILLCVGAVLATQNDRFLTSANLLNQTRLMTELGLIAVAMTFVIITGGIDLSVGSILGLSAILVGELWKMGVPLPIAAVLAIAAGTLGGVANGIIITRFRVPPLIATLATLALYRGLAEGISQAQSVRGYPAWFLSLGQGNLFGIPAQLWLLAVVVIIAIVILRVTPIGRAVYAIGNNEAAARYSGIEVDRIKLWIYAASGFLASTAAVVFVARVSTTRSDMGTGLELDAITAVVLGGTSIFGGRGTIIGTLLGLMLIQVLKNGLSLSGVKGDGTVIVIGVVLIVAVIISNLVNRFSRD
ncbi:ABC transporter permease [Agrobacterium rubi]|uniref:Autoinducer 2 import system permease protein LsrD n=1 Tax=Agrobacterium rubi TaxID=28099 RepID=A0AAE7R8J1_9HYPH|nr:ABC transporter permease [Agrobacterium rubi]NTE88390.1 ABC transporter permease [Agrobacterium rubi]NTF04156.1 ABC transporter permease [Agrobacterium rubi]NTF09570.1 ABC transporter permease [Agrobacterium rubi]NTF22477.1 ABC transporter permease [Agrobacterium rubi]NTF29334.1 ABC transporter permease [Agrobacterium rubi]